MGSQSSMSSIALAPDLHQSASSLEQMTESQIRRISQQYVRISVMSVTLTIGYGKHHFIQAVNPRSPYTYRFQWGNGSSKKNTAFRTKRPERAKICIKDIFEDVTLGELYQAYLAASEGRVYSLTNYNCNHWTEEVVALLGKEIEVNHDCYCRTQDEGLTTQQREKLQAERRRRRRAQREEEKEDSEYRP